MAARLCRNAGYHREESYRLSLSEEETQNRKWLFWTIYAVDHAMSLNFGQAANIPDFDLTVVMPSRTGHNDPPWSKLWIWVEVARIQGKVYEQLYSARAQQMDSEARASSARDLAAELHTLQESFKVGTTALCKVKTYDCSRPMSTNSRTSINGLSRLLYAFCSAQP